MTPNSGTVYGISFTTAQVDVPQHMCISNDYPIASGDHAFPRWNSHILRKSHQATHVWMPQAVTFLAIGIKYWPYLSITNPLK